jgi:adenylate cyclase
VVQRDGEERASYVLGGTVRGAGQRVRVTAHLTYAPNGRRLWSERWERTTDDIFAVQDELAAAVVACVSPEIDAHEKSLVGERPVHTLTARELSLRTNAILSTGQIGVFDEAAALIERAVELEPRNAEAHAQKALVGYRKACSGAWPPRDQLIFALEAAREALTLDPRLASGYGTISVIYGMLGETDRALDAADRLAGLNPNAWGAPHGRSVALAFAPPDWVTDPTAHAAALLDHAEATLRMAPTSAYRSGHLFFLGLGVLMRDEASDLSHAVTALDRSATEPGASWWPSLFLALAELRRGQDGAAHDRICEARKAFAALSLPAVKALFGGSHVGARWTAEIDHLPDTGLPRD